MALDRPVHAPETADGTTAPAVAAPLTSGFAAYGGLAQMPPRFSALAGRRRVMIASGRLAPWPADHPLGRPGPERPPGPIADGLIALEWDVPARSAALISGAARVGETPTTRIPEFAHTRALRHATFTRLCVPDDGAADAGIPDAKSTTARSERVGPR